MPPRFAPIARLIATILFLQVVLAPAHCLAMATAPAGLDAVICSAEGARTLHLGPDGQEMPASLADEGFCPGCHGLPQVVLPARLAAPLPVRAELGTAWHPTAPEAVPPPARGPPFAPRGPPAFG